MSYLLSFSLDDLKDEIQQTTKIFICSAVDKTFAIRLINEIGISVTRNLNEADHLIIAEANHRVVDASLIEPQPIIMRFAIRPYAETVSIHADSRPFPKPRSDFHPRSDPGNGLGLQVKSEDPDLDRTAPQVTRSIPQLFD